jgi:hypothetical protein
MSAVSWLWMIRARVLAREEPAAERQESRVFFFEKKNQKLLPIAHASGSVRDSQ